MKQVMPIITDESGQEVCPIRNTNTVLKDNARINDNEKSPLPWRIKVSSQNTDAEPTTMGNGPPSDLLEATKARPRRQRYLNTLPHDQQHITSVLDPQNNYADGEALSPTSEIVSPVVEVLSLDFPPGSVASLSRIPNNDEASLRSVSLLSTRNAASSIVQPQSVQSFLPKPDGFFNCESAPVHSENVEYTARMEHAPKLGEAEMLARDSSWAPSTSRFLWGSFHQEKKKKAKSNNKTFIDPKPAQPRTGQSSSGVPTVKTLKRGFSGIFGRLGSNGTTQSARQPPVNSKQT